MKSAAELLWTDQTVAVLQFLVEWDAPGRVAAVVKVIPGYLLVTGCLADMAVTESRIAVHFVAVNYLITAPSKLDHS